MLMDLKYSFMTGSAEFLTHHFSLLVPSRIRTVFRSVLNCLPNSKLFKSFVFHTEFWKVVDGGGMVLRCSPELADAAFLYALDTMRRCNIFERCHGKL